MTMAAPDGSEGATQSMEASHDSGADIATTNPGSVSGPAPALAPAVAATSFGVGVVELSDSD